MIQSEQTPPSKLFELTLLDLQNTLQVWLHSVLFYKKIYPQICFTKRNFNNIQVIVSKSETLNNYIDSLLKEIRLHFLHLNNVQIWLIDAKNNCIEVCYFHIGYLQLGKNQNQLQKNIQMKQFFSQLKQMKPPKSIVTTFKVKMDYRLQDQIKNQQSQSISMNWLKSQQFLPSNQANTQKKSLKTDYLNIICEEVKI